jgi:hypothetical protein
MKSLGESLDQPDGTVEVGQATAGPQWYGHASRGWLRCPRLERSGNAGAEARACDGMRRTSSCGLAWPDGLSARAEAELAGCERSRLAPGKVTLVSAFACAIMQFLACRRFARSTYPRTIHGR